MKELLDGSNQLFNYSDFVILGRLCWCGDRGKHKNTHRQAAQQSKQARPRKTMKGLDVHGLAAADNNHDSSAPSSGSGVGGSVGEGVRDAKPAAKFQKGAAVGRVRVGRRLSKPQATSIYCSYAVRLYHSWNGELFGAAACGLCRTSLQNWCHVACALCDLFTHACTSLKILTFYL